MPKYLERFQHTADVQAYDETEYGGDSYSSFIWQLQRPILREVIEERRATVGKLRLLDFACGTGRILSFVEDLVDTSDGIDRSQPMLERATVRCQRSRLIAGDIVEDRTIASGPYEIITAFRFLLNAEDSVRVAVLQALRARIDEERGILIANVHGNAFSSRHLALKYRRWQATRRHASAEDDSMLAEMRKAEIVRLLRAGGFDLVRIVGFGVVPQFLHRTPAKSLARWVDHALVAKSFAMPFSIDLMFVCTPSKSDR